jgi:hypothetical protein
MNPTKLVCVGMIQHILILIPPNFILPLHEMTNYAMKKQRSVHFNFTSPKTPCFGIRLVNTADRLTTRREI